MKKTDLPVLGALNIFLGFLVFVLSLMLVVSKIQIGLIIISTTVIFVGIMLLFGEKRWKDI
ncbi:MAG: hypothetical protein KKG43_08160 [Candidatus Omnitrophica bacterium]|nr:hypothetical protein [Candidatus Omnitrophota bacterium]MBU1928266.1 hypothetical protein [Candidatus Omnitrophota bacterium]MBU2035420.1 hypothetical protein [Candidatus Omnitrophota bacterium]MBU2221020.1 hypothetical protein [Candidatus Omnitrophota bacterium]MBU2258905.1 hypothetical protein [Candidatus Omnitrophota bacterium]